MRRAMIVSLCAAWVVIGCGSTKQFYDGPKLESDAVALLKFNLDSGARVVRIDDRTVTETDSDDFGPACFRGKVALLPGEHTLEVVYHDTYYTNASRTSGDPSMTVLTSSDTKELTFIAKEGHVYRVEAASHQVEWPPNALAWRTWVVEIDSGDQVAVAPEE